MQLSQLTRKQIITFGAIGLGVLILILVLIGFLPGRRGGDRVSLEFWGIDDEKVWEPTIKSFRRVYPEVSIDYTEVDPDSYESDLVNALAAGRGPDVFMFKSTWLSKHQNKLYPAPTSKISADTVSGLFPQVVLADFVSDERVYALPVSVDTLALVYNRDIFDRKGVALPPKTWSDFEAAIGKLRAFEGGNLTLAGASIGGVSRNIPNTPDILSLLLIQRGSLVISPDLGKVDLTDRTAEEAVTFYLNFGDPESSVYTWNSNFDSSIEAFADERAAMILAYADELSEIEERNPSIDLAVSQTPQFTLAEPINFAKYWGLAVSSTSAVEARAAAWDFVIFATTDETSATGYLKATSRPPALRFLINQYLNDSNFGVFAGQALTAKSWPQPDENKVKSIFDKMIESVSAGELSLKEALERAEVELNILLRK